MPRAPQPAAVHTDTTEPLSRGKRIRAALRPYRRGLLVLLLPVSFLLTQLARRGPAAVETVFSRGIYRVFSGILGRLFGLFPFSVAEWLLYGCILTALVWLAVQGVRLIRRPQKRKRLLSMLATACCVAGSAYFLFTIFCGLNYHRLTFAEQSGLQIRDSSAQELAAVYAELVESANVLRGQVNIDDSGGMALSQSYSAAGKEASAAMGALANTYPFLSGYTPPAKAVLASRGMSHLDISGIYIPFTFEGNVNVDVPDYYIPFSMVHELAHYKGFMREDEANFIAYLGCRESGDPAFAYSGVTRALVYSGNALYKVDRDLYFSIYANLSEQVRLDFAQGAVYWKQFEGPVAQVASQVNDSYLKSNGQEEGVRSYGRMVDLLLADYRARHGLR